MTDRIVLRGVRARGRHGVLPEERRDGQTFLVDAVLEIDVSAAAASDRLSDTVDYGDLSRRLAGIVGGEPVNLVETLAVRLATACLDDPRVRAAEVTVRKPEAPMPVPFEEVAVTVRRSRA